MPTSQPGTQDDEPGRRNGEGSESILPHLQRQVQTQIKQPLKKPRPNDADGPESQPYEHE
jgi:hypothetical protein